LTNNGTLVRKGLNAEQAVELSIVGQIIPETSTNSRQKTQVITRTFATVLPSLLETVALKQRDCDKVIVNPNSTIQNVAGWAAGCFCCWPRAVAWAYFPFMALTSASRQLIYRKYYHVTVTL
jgi:hypothetical protein